MIKTLKVILWGEEVGRLAWEDKRKSSYFTYNADFIRKGLNISPLVAPIEETRTLIPIWGEKSKKYVISKNKEAFSLIEKTGISSLSQEQLTSLVETCFKL